MIALPALAEKLKKEKSVALIIHVRPDGDCIGSGCALKLALQKAGVKAEVFCRDDIPSRFFFLEEPKKIRKDFVVSDYTALVAVDCADLFRLGDYADEFRAHKNTFNIDHHISNSRFARKDYVFERGANCENVMDIIKEAGIPIDKEMANLLLMGIITDTGDFRHKNVTPDTLYKAGELVSLGADINAISFYMFTAQTKERAKLFGDTMSAIRYFENGEIAIATVFNNAIEKSGAKPDETEGFIDFVMGIYGVKVGVCIMEKEKDKFKVSFRSHKTDVNAVAGVFGGGGHVLASGCQICGEYEEVVDKIVSATKRFLE